jgi:RHS repeat-associated protein
MKTLSCRWTTLLLGLAIFLSGRERGYATITVDSTSSFEDVMIDPLSGSVEYLGALQSSAFAQAGANSQYDSVDPSTVGVSDVPVIGGLATGTGTASASSLTGSSGATGFIPGTTAGFDTSTGRASISGEFEIIGPSEPVSVTFSATVDGQLNLSSDAYGVFGQGETDFALSVNDDPVLFSDQILSIGPNQIQSSGGSPQQIENSMTLEPDTPYWLTIEADAETEVVNSTVAAVPEPGEISLVMEGLAMLAFVSLWRQRQAVKKAANQGLWIFLGGVVALGLAAPAHAKFIGGDTPDPCPTCGGQPNRLPGGTIGTSLSEGNDQDNYPVQTVQSGYGATLSLKLTYNSYNADGSKAQLNTVMGFGWTHSYNIFLFSESGNMFLYDGAGRVTKFNMNYNGSGGTYASDAGYFETMTKQADGSFIVTNKNESWWHFGAVPNTPFLVGGPVYQLLQMGDRNNNLTTMSYNANGLLATATDPFGRTLQFTYNASNKLSSVTDPLGRTTTFQYDALDRMPVTITDPMGNTVQYTYNAQDQMTRKVDRDGRMYFYTYKNLLPFMVTDGNGQPYLSLGNSNNWAVNQTNLTYSLERQYVPSTTTSTDGNGNVWRYSYDTNGYITQTVAPDGTTTTYTYDPGSREISSKTDANGNTTLYQYDSQGNRISMTDSLGNLTTYTYEPVFNQMTSMTDPNGRTTTYFYDGNGNRIKAVDPLGQTQSWTYDSNGNILSSTDKRGYTTTYHYDSDGELISMVDPLGDTASYTYDAVGNRLSMTDANGHATLYQYDALDRLIQTTDALGHITSTTYDGAGNVLSRTDANGRTTTYGYDQRSRLITTTDALGNVSSMTYDANNNVLSRTDANDHTTTCAYDTLNRLITTTDPLGGVSLMTYDPVGNIITQTDANAHTTTNGYDALNRRISSVDPLGNTTTYDYASVGGLPCCGATAGSDLLTGVIDANGKYTYYHYDELNRRVQEVHKSGSTNDVNTPSDAIITTTYDADDNRIAITDPNTNTTTMGYDALDRRIAMTNAAGDVSTTAYDPVGNVVQTVDPRGNVTTYTYDAINRVIEKADSIGLVSTTVYDPAGNVITNADGNGNITATTYDAVNRRITVTDPLGNPTTYNYDPVGNIINTTDRDGNITLYEYDADNRQASMTDALGNITANAYDPVGNMISLTDPLGHVTIYTYDADNRQIKETYADTPSDTRAYGYDATGHIISRLDQNGQTTTYQYNDFYYLTNRQYSVGPNAQYNYDLGGRVTNATRNGWTDSYTYDGANRVLSAVQNGQVVTYTYIIPSGIRTLTYPHGTIVTETYDLRSRLVEVNDAGSPAITQYTYDLADNVLTRTNRNGTFATYFYNSDNWVTQLTHSNATTLITGFVYTYDKEGNITSQMNMAESLNSEGYAYDALYRLTNFDVGAFSGGVIPSPSIAESFNLDAVGNWSSFVSNSVTQTRAHNAVNEITDTNGSPLTYDANGNLANDGSFRYSYDVENRLTTVTRASDSAMVGQYTYDAFGRRIEETLQHAFLAAAHVFIYDGTRILEEQDGGGTGQANFTYGNYIDEVLTMSRNGQVYYYHPNVRFSIEALTDSSGTPVERYAYDSYGEPRVVDGLYNPVAANAWGTPHSAVTNFFMFTGRQFDEESGLYFYRARYQHPRLGRFLQRDPASALSEMVNLYEYADSNPVNSLDPSGMLALTIQKNPPAPTPGFCGAFSWTIMWQLDKPSKDGGYVMQDVTGTFRVWDCTGKEITQKSWTFRNPATGKMNTWQNPLHYWEVWKVGKNKKAPNPNGDTFSWIAMGCNEGTATMEGKARFYDGVDKLPKEGGWEANNPKTGAGILWSTVDDPTGSKPFDKGGTDPIDHILKAKWNCCPGTKSTVTEILSHTP